MTRRLVLRRAAALAACALALLAADAASAVAKSSEIVSLADGCCEQGNADSGDADVSADGRYVAFTSTASNLVDGDTNARDDVFVRDRVSGATERMSVSSTGAQGNGDSFRPSISDDGRYVAFGSIASNLVPGDSGDSDDVFLHDRLTGTTEFVNRAIDGTKSDGISSRPSISSDGRFVAFISTATNLVEEVGGRRHAYVRDRLIGYTELISVSTSGARADDIAFDPTISGNGRFVAWVSVADNLVPNDTNRSNQVPGSGLDVFVRDRQLRTTERASVSSSGAQGNDTSGANAPHLSDDGRFVVFDSLANTLVPGDTNGDYDVFVRDRKGAGTTTRVSVAPDGSQSAGPGAFVGMVPQISGDGQRVTFNSGAGDLVTGDTNDRVDGFVRDLRTGVNERVTVAPDGSQLEAGSAGPLSTDGRYVVMNLPDVPPEDINEVSDVYLRDLAPVATETGAASAVGGSSANLAGTVTPHGERATYVFEYGPTLAFGAITTPRSAGSGQAPVAVTEALTGLPAGATAYYRLVATGPSGTSFGEVRSLRTTGGAQAPAVITGAASAVTSTSAALVGQVNPRGQQTAFTFEYGPSTSFGAITTVTALDDGDGLEAVSAALTGLTPNTTYLFRLVATNATGTTTGSIGSFTTGGT